jgi:DNA ligase (NAD+)
LEVTDAADIYLLRDKKEKLADLKLSGKTRLGEKRAEKILAEIDKVRELTLSQFLGSLGLPGLGKRRVALIQKAGAGEFDTLEDWTSGKLVKLADQAGVPNLAARFQKEIDANMDLIKKLLASGVIIKKDQPTPSVKPGALVFCITGALSQPKSFFWDKITKAGHVATDDFNKTVTHLVAADPNGTSSKLQKARKQGTPILSETELLKLL